MENNTTPNTPAELFAMQAANKEVNSAKDGNDYNAFADFLVEEILPDLEPTPYQTVKAIEKLLFRLKAYHFDVLNDDESELDSWNRCLWQEDYDRLSKALDAIRLINPD